MITTRLHKRHEWDGQHRLDYNMRDTLGGALSASGMIQTITESMLRFMHNLVSMVLPQFLPAFLQHHTCRPVYGHLATWQDV